MVDRSAIGRSLTPVHASVEPGRLRYFFDTLGERNPVYRDAAAAKAAGYAAIPVPPTYLFCLEMMDAEEPFEFFELFNVDIGRILHGEQRFTYHAPVVAGDALTFNSRVTDVADKKGGALTIVNVTTDVINQHGQRVAEAVRTIVIRN
jgi:acyl dehydratase